MAKRKTQVQSGSQVQTPTQNPNPDSNPKPSPKASLEAATAKTPAGPRGADPKAAEAKTPDREARQAGHDHLPPVEMGARQRGDLVLPSSSRRTATCSASTIRAKGAPHLHPRKGCRQRPGRGPKRPVSCLTSWSTWKVAPADARRRRLLRARATRFPACERRRNLLATIPGPISITVRGSRVAWLGGGRRRPGVGPAPTSTLTRTSGRIPPLRPRSQRVVDSFLDAGEERLAADCPEPSRWRFFVEELGDRDLPLASSHLGRRRLVRGRLGGFASGRSWLQRPSGSGPPRTCGPSWPSRLQALPWTWLWILSPGLDFGVGVLD